MKTVCEIAAKLRRLPLGVSAPSIEKATTVCRKCGTGYVPAIVRLQGHKKTVTRVRPCPACGLYREPKVQETVQYQIRHVPAVRTWETVLDNVQWANIKHY